METKQRKLEKIPNTMSTTHDKKAHYQKYYRRFYKQTEIA